MTCVWRVSRAFKSDSSAVRFKENLSWEVCAEVPLFLVYRYFLFVWYLLLHWILFYFLLAELVHIFCNFYYFLCFSFFLSVLFSFHFILSVLFSYCWLFVFILCPFLTVYTFLLFILFSYCLYLSLNICTFFNRLLFFVLSVPFS